MFEKFGNITAKFKNAFGASNPGNIKTIQGNFEEHRKLYMYLADVNLKITSDFRTAHMNIIAGMIAFLGFLAKDGIVENIDFKRGVFCLLAFIFFSILSILWSFGYDSYLIKSNLKVLGKSLKASGEAKDRAKNLELTKNEAQEYNLVVKNLKIDEKKYIFYFISGVFLLTWFFLLLGLFFVLKYFYSLF